MNYLRAPQHATGSTSVAAWRFGETGPRDELRRLARAPPACAPRARRRDPRIRACRDTGFEIPTLMAISNSRS
jgi:hypothetical protein